MKYIFSILLCALVSLCFGQHAASTVKEYDQVFKTYPFSDPDPIPKLGTYYPYFRFDGYTDKPIDKAWKVVELENEFIKVMILPEIGGKIWTAIEKSTGKPFIYYNHVVKFRDIAMRGPWTSGGIEANYGIIGHTPNCSTPVDYLTRTNPDGSVSCFIGTLDLLTRTYWTIEVNLPKDKAYFTTRSFWSNTNPIEQPYYTWMNAGIPAAGNLEFVYPGNKYLSHDGDAKEWKINPANGRDISFYKQNDFGPYKSYHVFGNYTDFFGGYWHKEDFGMGRYATHDDKAGKKIWIWGLSQQGMIWEKLLTDNDGQYVEVQSGRLFNQTAESSTFTPFKHKGFEPFSTDTWTEYWFPVKGTKGFVKANPYAAINVRIRGGYIRMDISPLQDIREKLTVEVDGKEVYSKVVDLKILKLFSDSVTVSRPDSRVEIRLGTKLVVYSSNPEESVLSRPVSTPPNFDWNSIQGLHIQGREFIRERNYAQAAEKLKEAFAKEPHYIPALSDLALLACRNGEYEKSRTYSLQALSIDTYDPASNYYYGLASARLGKYADARDGFDIAAMSSAFRTAAYTELSRLSIIERDFVASIRYAQRSLETNALNIEGLQLLSVASRLSSDPSTAQKTLARLKELNPLNHFARFEEYLSNPSNKGTFTSMIRSELATETYLELASWYAQLGRFEDARVLLGLASPNAEVFFWLAYVDHKLGAASEKGSLNNALVATVEFVFPFRQESVAVLKWAVDAGGNWKSKYLLALLYWNLNQTDAAVGLLKTVGDTPDAAPFYAFRAELILESRLKDLQRAATLAPNQWRYGKLLIQHHIKEKQYPLALQVASDYDKRFPNDFRLRLLLAKTQLLKGDYALTNKTLESTNVLPFEGSTEGRAIHREAWIMQAADRYKAGKFLDVLKMTAAARGYPENLGVGKPYDEDIDSREENYLDGMCYEKLKRPDMAKAKWVEITSAVRRGNGANDLITAWAFRKLGQPEKGEALLRAWKTAEPRSALATFCVDAFRDPGTQPPSALDEDSEGRMIKALFMAQR